MFDVRVTFSIKSVSASTFNLATLVQNTMNDSRFRLTNLCQVSEAVLNALAISVNTIYCDKRSIIPFRAQ